MDFHGCVFLVDPSPGLQNTPRNFQDLPQERFFNWTNMSADQRGFQDGLKIKIHAGIIKHFRVQLCPFLQAGDEVCRVAKSISPVTA